MKWLLLFSLCLPSLVCGAEPEAGSFSSQAGLQLYSLRDLFKKDVPAALDFVKAAGVTEVETAGTYGLPAKTFRELLEARGLKAVSGHFPYEMLMKNLPSVIADAQALGLKYVACAWIPHGLGPFDKKDARKAAADFNTCGEALEKAGLHFAYHTHGYEFEKDGEGTLFDLLMRETKPQWVHFEMDVFWIADAGQDPVALLEKYPSRWALLHLKDRRAGAHASIIAGLAPPTDSVPLGTGQIAFPAVLKSAAKIGVKFYFIEDESPTAQVAIPQSLRYLETLR